MLIQRSLIASAINCVAKVLFSCSSRALASGGILAAWVSAAVAGPSIPSRNGYFNVGNLVVTESVYAGYPSLITPGSTVLPNGAVATGDGSYPNVFNNESADPSFGVTAPIIVEQLTKTGVPVSRLAVPVRFMTSSFSSKSELAVHLSTDGTVLTFIGYVAPVNTFDVSNSNTPRHFDPSNPVPGTYQRATGNIDVRADIYVKPVNAYSGNNGRAVILHDWVYYMVGNSGNGTQKGVQNIVDNTGVQIAPVFSGPDTTVVGQQQGTVGASTGYQYGYSVTQDGYPPDTSGKDDNFRGITIFNETLYVTKGSGSNGINTVYQVGDSGRLPSFATALTTRITIPPGFSTTLANSKTGTVYHPFGIWFANPTTLYVADEGDGNLNNAATGFGGLQKWILAGVRGTSLTR